MDDERESPCDSGCPYSSEPYVLLRWEDHKERWEAMRSEAQEDARRIARALVEEHEVRKVWLFGSTAGVWIFHEWSDIDLAFEGPYDWWLPSEIQDRLARMTRFPLDIRNVVALRDFENMIPKPVLLAQRTPT